MQSYKTKTFSIVPGTGWMETKVDVPGRKVCGYFAAFGNKDADGDIIVPGAFAKSISERGPRAAKPRILFLRDHDSAKVLGRVDVLREDEKGLYFEAQIANTQLGDETLELYKMGALTEHSIGFQTVKSRYDSKEKTNYLEELKLWEGSVVAWGANEQTPLVGIKSIKGGFERLETLAKQAPDDEYKQRMYVLIEQLKAEAALEGKEPPDEGTPEPAEPQADAKLVEVITRLKEIKNLI